MKTPNLIDILSEPTEHKQPSFLETSENTKTEDFQTIDTEIPEPPKVNLDDFAPEIEKRNPPEPVKPEVKKTLSFSEQKESAKMVVATYDAIQTLTFPFLYKKALFSREELKMLNNIKVKMRQDGETSLTEEEVQLYDKYTTLEDLSQNVGFTEEEAELIIQPLAKVFAKYNISIGPELLLIGSLATVSLPRFLPFFSPLEKL